MTTREEAIHVLALLSDGVPIVQSCKELGITRSKLYVAIDRECLGDMHARAREEYAEARVAEMQNIAETVEDVARAKLLCDNSAAFGCTPKRSISSAAITVISASCSAVGS